MYPNLTPTVVSAKTGSLQCLLVTTFNRGDSLQILRRHSTRDLVGPSSHSNRERESLEWTTTSSPSPTFYTIVNVMSSVSKFTGLSQCSMISSSLSFFLTQVQKLFLLLHPTSYSRKQPSVFTVIPSSRSLVMNCEWLVSGKTRNYLKNPPLFLMRFQTCLKGKSLLISTQGTPESWSRKGHKVF